MKLSWAAPLFIFIVSLASVSPLALAQNVSSPAQIQNAADFALPLPGESPNQMLAFCLEMYGRDLRANGFEFRPEDLAQFTLVCQDWAGINQE